MIVGTRKSLEDITKMLAGYRKVVVLGCGECVTVCLSGGQKEVAALASQLRLQKDAAGDGPEEVVEQTIERQCDKEFFDPILEELKGADAVLSMACGVGVNFAAGLLEDIPVFPALDTSHMGATMEYGKWQEMCAGCGKCILDLTGGICPVARCAKTILNGPCGGSNEGKCEISDDTDCVWVLIIERMKKLGTLDKLNEIIDAKDWSTARDGGPRTTLLPELTEAKAE